MNLSNGPIARRVVIVLILAGLVLFGASFNDPFHFDDVLITNDANVTNPAQWAHFLNPLHLRQLTFFSFYLNNLITGDSPAGYHIVNVMLHIANAVLVFFLFGRFFERWIATAAAAIFLVHPIQTEPVLYIYQRSALLACFFSLLALIALSEKRNWLAVVFFICAFESKESAVAVPVAVAALGGAYPLPLGEVLASQFVMDRRYRFGLMIGAVILAFASLALLVYWGESTVGLRAGDALSPASYFMAQTRIFYTYLRLLFFPYPQSLEYEFPPDAGIFPLIGILAIGAAAWWLSKQQRWRVPGLSILAFFILLAPTSSIVPSADPAFEHRLYLPMLAFSLLGAWLLSRLPGRTAVTFAVMCIFAVLTVNRGTVWSSDIALWEDTAKRAPGKARVWFNLGGAYLENDADKARAALERALELEPQFVDAMYDIGIIEQRKGNWATALAYYERAVTRQPAYWPAWNNMGNTVFSMGQSARSIEYFEKTLSLNRDYWPAQYNIAVAQFMIGRYSEAIPKLKIVLDWRPDFREARYLMAVSLTRAGYREESDKEWQKLGETNATESRITPTMILAPNRP